MVNISATIDDSLVNIVDLDVNGSDIYISYITSAQNLNVTKKFYALNNDYVTIATSATIN